MKKENIKWTQFWDMHSGGGIKESPYEIIYIQAPEAEAKVIFYNRFGHSPERVSCTCCGEDYSVSESETLKEATAYHRNCKYDNKSKKYIEEDDRDYKTFMTLSEYIKQPDVLVIFDEDIKLEERKGEVPKEGYVWL